MAEGAAGAREANWRAIVEAAQRERPAVWRQLGRWLRAREGMAGPWDPDNPPTLVQIAASAEALADALEALAPAPAEVPPPSDAATAADPREATWARTADALREFAGGEFPFSFRGGKSLWCGTHRVYHPETLCALLTRYDAERLIVAPASAEPGGAAPLVEGVLRDAADQLAGDWNDERMKRKAADEEIERLRTQLSACCLERDGYRIRLQAVHRPAPAAGDAAAVVEGLKAEVTALQAKINSPETRDFVEAVMREAAHQRERWGERESYTELEWAGVATWLVGKAGVTMFQTNGDTEKYLHRIITVAALAANWHRNALRVSALGEGTAPRP